MARKRIEYRVGKPYYYDENGKENYNIKNQKDILIDIHINYEYGEPELKTCGYRTAKEVYKMIDNNNINLNECYVKDFSLKEYRKGNSKYFKNKYVELNNFSAREAFFDGKVDFSHAQFNDDYIKFFYVQFGDEYVDFSWSRFANGYAGFADVEFGDRGVNFDNVRFGDGDVDFSGAQFGDGKVYFRWASFPICKLYFSAIYLKKGEIDFFGAKFDNVDINFSNSAIDSIHFENNYFRDRVNFEVSRCNSFSLINCQFDKSFIFSDCKFKSADFYNTKIIGKMYIKWKENNIKNAIINSVKDKLESDRYKANQFLILKENFRNIGRYDDEDKAYFEYKYHELRADLKEGLNKYIYGFRLVVFEEIGGYGTKPLSIAKTMLWVWLGSSLAYIFLDFLSIIFSKWNVFIQHVYSLDLLIIFKHIGKAFYHSAITFLTIGYGNIYDYDNIPLWANFAIKLVSGIEGFFGLFLMAFFVVAYARKVLR